MSALLKAHCAQRDYRLALSGASVAAGDGSAECDGDAIVATAPVLAAVTART